MKKMLRLFSAAALMFGISASGVFAQSQVTNSNKAPMTKEESATKDAKQAHQKRYMEQKLNNPTGVTSNVRAEEAFGSEAEKRAFIEANEPQKEVETTHVVAPGPARTMGSVPGKGKSVGTSSTPVIRVSNVHKAKPANYKAPSNGTKTEEK